MKFKMLNAALMAVAMLFAGVNLVSAEEKKVSPEMAKFNAMLKGANSALDAAAKVGGEWRDARWKKSTAVKVKMKDGKTKKTSVLGAAKLYAEMGDFKKANKLVKKAVFQADMGYKQALEQKHAKAMWEK